MTRLQIIGHKRDLDATLEAVQQLACVQIMDSAQVHTGLRPYGLADEQREIESLSYLHASLDALLALLPPQAEEKQITWTGRPLVSSLQIDLETHTPALEELARQQDALSNDAEVLPAYAATLKKLVRLTPELTELKGYETVALLVHRRYRSAIDLLAEEVEQLTDKRFELVSDQIDPDTIGAILVFPREMRASVLALLGRVQVNQVNLPLSLQDVPFQDALTRIQQRMQSIPDELAQIDIQLREVSALHRARWLGARQAVSRRLEQLQVRKRLGETDHTFVLAGWIPVRDLDTAHQTLQQLLPNTLIVEEIPPTPEEAQQAPVLLENPATARPFEFFIRLLSLPRAGTLDPTALMALFMPLFFGLMLADIGYGVVIFAITFFLYKKAAAGSDMRSLVSFLMMGAVWAILWGVVFGEFFGSLGHSLGLHALWKERSDPDALAPLLIFSMAVGAIHVTLGLILGVWQAWHLRHPQELWERTGMLVGLAGIFLLVAVAARQLPSGWTTPGLVIVVVGLALLIRGMGSIGALMAPVELLSTVGNILSYLRLAAIGLASVYLAMVGNELAGRIGIVWVGVIVALLFHALNIAMGAFSPSIHALRLHYVEFFTKFYEPGGESFQPYGLLAQAEETSAMNPP